MKSSIPTKLLPFFWHFIKPHKWMMASLFLTGLIWGIHTSITPYLLKLIIDNIANFQGDRADIFTAVKWPVIFYIVGWIFMAAIFRLTDYIMLRFFPQVRQDIINEIFAYINRHSYSYMQNNFAGSLSNKMNDISGSAASLLRRVDETSANIFAFLIALIATYLVSPLFFLILLTWAVVFLFITYLFSKNTKILSQEFSESKSAMAGKIVDVLGNLTNTRLFARNAYENSRLNEAVSDTVYKDRKVQKQIMVMRIYWDFTFITLISSMLCGLVYMYSLGKISVGDFAFIMGLSINIFMHMWNMAAQFVQFAEEVGKCVQALSIINVPHEITDSENSAELVVKQGTITFENVTFKYQRNNNLFQNKQVQIAPGSKVGLVGFSGSGKTTFVNLILRFFDIESGRILIDGQDIKTVTQDSLRQQIAMIPQDTSLFHRTLMENIRYGRLDATDAQVIAAAKNAHCHEFIDNLPEKYNALVGERGIKLSGGQRQRIAIARAMLKNAPILILDEATSALDSVTEQHIQQGLETLMENRTTIVIAHRLSTLAQMDRILVFDKGQIIEDGTHKKLLKNKGHYAKMWQMQAGGFLPEIEGGK